MFGGFDLAALLRLLHLEFSWSAAYVATTATPASNRAQVSMARAIGAGRGQIWFRVLG